MVTEADRERYELGKRLLKEKRFSEAYALYEELARDGDPNCQVQAGWMCHEGLGTAKDQVRALDWFKKAASVGSAIGAFYCGRLANIGGRYDEAVKWFSRSTEGEYGPALLWLGLAHLRGTGVAVNRERGITYLQRSAAIGNYFARRQLALMMIRGEFGLLKVVHGLVLLPYAVFGAVVEAFTDIDSHKLIG